MPIHAYMQMPTGVANITTRITQVTLKLVNYAVLVNKLWFGLTCLELLGNFPTDKHGLDCCLQLDTKVFKHLIHGHLHVRVDGHKNRSSLVRKHYDKENAVAVPDDLLSRFKVLKKCRNKFDCLINEITSYSPDFFVHSFFCKSCCF